MGHPAVSDGAAGSLGGLRGQGRLFPHPRAVKLRVNGAPGTVVKGHPATPLMRGEAAHEWGTRAVGELCGTERLAGRE
jgi:hypothetical protein